MNRCKFNIWVGALLLLAMLATCYAATVTLCDAPPHISAESPS